MRYRVKDDRTRGTVTYVDYNCDASFTETVFQAGYLGTKIETQDVITPNFKRRIRAGEIIVNPYTHTKEVWFNSNNGSLDIEPSGNCVNNYAKAHDHLGVHLTHLLENTPRGYDQPMQRLVPKWVYTQSEVDDAIDLAATRAWSDAAGNDAQLLVIIAEMHKTVRMLLHPLQNLTRFLKKVLRDKRRDPRPSVATMSLLEYLGAEWLTYRFGVRPLLFDIQNVLKAVTKPHKSGLERHKGTYKMSRSYDYGTLSCTMGSGTCQYRLNIDHTVTVRCGFMRDAEGGFQDALGLRISDIPSAIWELIPFSFVIDWFFNIGEFLSTLPAWGGPALKGAFTTIEHHIVVTRTTLGYTPPADPGGWTQPRGPNGVEVLDYTNRNRIVGVRLPSLGSKLSIFDINFKDLRVLDAIALIRQMLSHR